MGKLTIQKGEDRVIPLTLTKKAASGIRSPFDLTSATKITVEFKQSDNEILSIDGIAAHGRFSSATFEDVIYTAYTIGVIGDSISLVFDGSDDIATVIAAFNVSNPGNTVNSDAADDTVVPSATTVNLSGGLDDFIKVVVIDAKLGQITVQLDNADTNSLSTGTGQNIRVIIDVGDHDLGNRRISVAKNVLDVVNDSL